VLSGRKGARIQRFSVAEVHSILPPRTESPAAKLRGIKVAGWHYAQGILSHAMTYSSPCTGRVQKAASI
ncbi:MAG: hypothetical protein WA183_17845, partial [Chthoniobacterales bacterium]